MQRLWKLGNFLLPMLTEVLSSVQLANRTTTHRDVEPVEPANQTAEARRPDAKKLSSPDEEKNPIIRESLRQTASEQTLERSQGRMRLNRDHKRGTRLAPSRTHFMRRQIP